MIIKTLCKLMLTTFLVFSVVITPANAGEYWLTDGIYSSFSEHKEKSQLEKEKGRMCLTWFFINKSWFPKVAVSDEYTLDRKALEKGHLRYIPTGSSKCTYDHETKIETCERADAYGTQTFYGLVGKIDDDEGLIEYGNLTEDEFKEYKVIRQLSKKPHTNYLFRCNITADLYKYMDNVVSNEDRKQAADVAFDPLPDVMWKMVIDILSK